jgi:hypothetical protein
LKISALIESLGAFNENSPIICEVPEYGVRSPIYVVAQVRENIPGFDLDDREPELSNFCVKDVVQQLTTFSDRFQENDLLFQLETQIDKDYCEFRYFKLSNVILRGSEVVLNSLEKEIIEFKERHLNPQDDFVEENN